jgi:hypothetical protein
MIGSDVLTNPAAACLSVSQEGTDEACAESLQTYQGEGYCLAGTGMVFLGAPSGTSPDAGLGSLGSLGSLGVYCFDVDLETCSMSWGATLGDASANCLKLHGAVVTSCPTKSLLGCCVSPPETPGEVRIGVSACYYSSTDGSVELAGAAACGMTPGGAESSYDPSSCCVTSGGVWSADIPSPESP